LCDLFPPHYPIIIIPDQQAILCGDSASKVVWRASAYVKRRRSSFVPAVFERGRARLTLLLRHDGWLSPRGCGS